MPKHSFATKLTWKIVALTSAIFISAIALVALYGSRIIYNNSINYSLEKLNTSVAEIEGVMECIECSTVGIGRTFESFYRSGQYLDTASMYKLFQMSIDENPFFIGIGVFFEPFLIRNNIRFGMYSWHNHDTGMEGNELYNDKSFEKNDKWDYYVLEWYSRCRDSGKRYWTSPYMEMIATVNDKPMERIVSSFSFPLTDNNSKVIGVCSCDLEMSWLEEKLNSMKPFNKSNVFIVDDSLNYVCNPESENPFSGNMNDNPLIRDFDWSDENWKVIGNTNITRLDKKGIPAFVTSKQMKNGWWVGIINYYDDVFADIQILIYALTGTALIGLLIIFFTMRMLSKKVSRPIVSFAGVANKITEGNFNVPVPEIKSKDEIEELGKALSYMQNSITNYIVELKRTTTEKERLASELNVARTIQMQMLAKHFPEIADCRLFACSNPAKEVGGDLYDFFATDKDLYFIIGDVSGKGVPAALLMAITISAFRASGKKGESVSEIVTLINNTFHKSNNDMMFVTVTVGKIDFNSGEMIFCNAGHNPMMHIHPNGKAEFVKELPNIACGIVPDFPFKEEKIHLKSGSRVVLYTDGITEAEDADKNQYGDERLLEWGASHSTSVIADEEQTVKELIESVEEFTKGAEQNDDMTIASISYTNSKVKYSGNKF